NEGAVAFGWGRQVAIHVDRNVTYNGSTYDPSRRRSRNATKRDLEGHYTLDGLTYRVDVDGNYPVGSEVTGYFPLLGGAVTTKTGGSAIFLSILGFVFTLVGLVIVWLSWLSFRSGRRKVPGPASAGGQPRPQPRHEGPMRYQGPPR
ncbi:MAG: hypothetical protein ACRDRN_06365, partial [Sciscionella sp.]